MTQSERNEAIKKLIEKRTKKTTASRKVARDTLIGEGVYTKKGELRVEYGGSAKKKAPAAA
jgi:hypothetical protein